jgi:hypothetical protein
MIAADVEELVVKYLSQTFPNVGLDLPVAPIPLPFYLVNKLHGPADWITEHNLVQVDAFAATRTAAATAARAMHNVMNPWVFTPKLSFTLSTGTAGIDSFEIEEVPAWHDYENPNLIRYCGRYRIELRMNQTS